MRLLKRWRCILFALVVIGSGALAAAYVRSPGYRAAQAYARIHEGMTFDEADKILTECGGDRVRLRMGIPLYDEQFCFGNRCSVGINLRPKTGQIGAACVKEKFLSRPTFTEWCSALADSFQSIFQDDAGSGSRIAEGSGEERMQELLNESENMRQISDEWKRFWETDRTPQQSNGIQTSKSIGSSGPKRSSNDANDRMQELLNDPEFAKQIKEEHKRFLELDRKTSSTPKQ